MYLLSALSSFWHICAAESRILFPQTACFLTPRSRPSLTSATTSSIAVSISALMSAAERVMSAQSTFAAAASSSAPVHLASNSSSARPISQAGGRWLRFEMPQAVRTLEQRLAAAFIFSLAHSLLGYVSALAAACATKSAKASTSAQGINEDWSILRIVGISSLRGWIGLQVPSLVEPTCISARVSAGG